MSQAAPEEYAAMVARRVPEFQDHGWEKLVARFGDQERDPVPEWMNERIRATDVGQFIDYLQAGTDWGWDDWEALPRVATPTLFLTGELEDPEDATAGAAARMPNASRIRLSGLGHINAFLRSDLALPHAMEFLGRHAT